MQRLQKGRQKTTPFYYYVGSYEKHNGINKRFFTIEKDNENNPIVRFCNFSTYGGSEYENNNIYVVDNTANVITWYDQSIKSNGAISLCEDPNATLYEILGEPENIEMRNQELSFKVRQYKGGA